MLPGDTFVPFRRFKGALIPETLLRTREVSRGAAQLYGQLARYAGEDGLCFPGQKTLAADFRVHLRTITRWVSELVEKKFLRASRRGLGTRSNSYEFLWHASLESGQLMLGETPLQNLLIIAGDSAAPAPAALLKKPVQSVNNLSNSRKVSGQKCPVRTALSLSERGPVKNLKSSSSSLSTTRAGGKPEATTTSPIENGQNPDRKPESGPVRQESPAKPPLGTGPKPSPIPQTGPASLRPIKSLPLEALAAFLRAPEVPPSEPPRLPPERSYGFPWPEEEAG